MRENNAWRKRERGKVGGRERKIGKWEREGGGRGGQGERERESGLSKYVKIKVNTWCVQGQRHTSKIIIMAVLASLPSSWMIVVPPCFISCTCIP
jgi:hypothetical protein